MKKVSVFALLFCACVSISAFAATIPSADVPEEIMNDISSSCDARMLMKYSVEKIEIGVNSIESIYVIPCRSGVNLPSAYVYTWSSDRSFTCLNFEGRNYTIPAPTVNVQNDKVYVSFDAKTFECPNGESGTFEVVSGWWGYKTVRLQHQCNN